MTSDAAGLAARLRAAREQAGLSQGQVARLLDFHRPTITEIEAGRRKVKTEELSRFAELYDVSASWLMKGVPEVDDPKVELAARELARLTEEDLERILSLLRTLRASKKSAK
jgi:transcriptional regulator with XRE-family HTH domain